MSDLRSAILWQANARSVRRSVRLLDQNRMQCFITVTPHLVHMAPLAILNAGAGIQHVFVANGLSDGDIEWLEERAALTPIIRLRTSLGRNPGSLLPHGFVIDCLAESSATPFCIQDADCFISDDRFWESVTLDPAKEFATCAFVRKGKGGAPDFPETFLTCLNSSLMKQFRKQLDIRSESTRLPSSRASRALAAAGYPAGRVLETLKDYYDTLQQFWVVATHHGYVYRRLEGEGESVHHIGGTSYLYRNFADLSHWDYWPLAVHYFNLRLLELPASRQFRARFPQLIEYHGSSDSLIQKFPEFAKGRRRLMIDEILRSLGIRF